jgi:phenylpropionate dioxygenase-like ring-hydroxylating dioxygenase large terminal subunit
LQFGSGCGTIKVPGGPVAMNAEIQRTSNRTPTASLIAARRPGHGLDRSFYHDPVIHAQDLVCIFHRHWLCAGHVSQATRPGDFFVVEVDSDRVIVVRDQAGRLHALLNVCRHRGSEVCTQRRGTADSFVCPYHAWTYLLDGTLAAARHMPPGFDRSAYGLRQLALCQAAGLVFVNFAPLRGTEAPGFDRVSRTLAASVGRYGWESARVAHRETYQVAANWKLAVENYVECYHCSPSHPEYSRLHALEQPGPRIARLNAAMEQRTAALGVEVASLASWRSDDGDEAIDCFRYALYDGVQTGSEDGRAVAPLMGAFSGYDGGATSIHVGGASFFLAYPDHGVIYRFWPSGIDRCGMELIWLVRGDAEPGRDYDPERLTWLWRITTEADKRIIEHTARGVASAFFEPGPLAPMEANEARYLDWYLGELARHA